MGLDEVRTEIIDEAESRAEVIREEAEARRDELLEDAQDTADEIVEQAKQEAEQEAEALRKKKLSSARMDAKKQRLGAREELLDDVYSQFRDEVQEIDDDTAADLLESALDRLDNDIDIGTVHTRSAHQDLAESYGAFAETDVRGLIVETADGSRQFDMRFDEITEQTISENRKDVSKVLFE
jgi:V/A-type H+-transporting ATPase subunit E